VQNIGAESSPWSWATLGYPRTDKASVLSEAVARGRRGEGLARNRKRREDRPRPAPPGARPARRRRHASDCAPRPPSAIVPLAWADATRAQRPPMPVDPRPQQWRQGAGLGRSRLAHEHPDLRVTREHRAIYQREIWLHFVLEISPMAEPGSEITFTCWSQSCALNGPE